ncbi:glycosyl hydrolase family 65 protein [Streptomyces sp. ICBB 8177]|uniref:glycoside hydrolase family 65 protein n=1 Tax=Streptomyces sp. ICBB 8177 TaxID=563922 RepID=UPI000D67D0D3|nr:glycosyl hydrolase family 65 protein [Streptomyces sp. ICBB 8177]PWI45093.1 trehalose 6-phosphate phosphorylase [Streptomyces sp. ICBB 8177]
MSRAGATADGADRWTWCYEGYDPAREKLRESLCALGNGYLATRGAAPETAADAVHYPGTYVAGCYDRLLSDVAGRQVENEDMVNLPNWLPLRFRVVAPDTEWFSPDDGSLLSYRQILHLHAGTLTRRMRIGLGPGRSLRVVQVRLVHMGDPHLAALRTYFTPDGWSGELEIEGAIDGDVRNAGVERYRDLRGDHLTGHRTGTGAGGLVWLTCRTRASGVRIAVAARLVVSRGRPARAVPQLTDTRAAQSLTVRLDDGATTVMDKTIALHTSRDRAIAEPLHAALGRVRRAPRFDRLRAEHRTAWGHLWQRGDLRVPGEAGTILRLHLFHVLQTLSPHTAELDVGVPARGLHGEAYRGHVFWDELFVLPSMNLRFPQVSRALLNYRHRRLPRACEAAREAGHIGAMYPWQSGSDGREESQTLHLNPRSGRWLPDHSRLQHHVGSAVVYNVWQYCQATGDADFLFTRGAEIVLQVARFWGEFATFDPAHGRYRVRGVMGPDEYHDAYPDADRPGLNDNSYTNVLAAWVLGRALDLARALPAHRRDELFERMALETGELERWQDVSRGLRVPFHEGVISQFDGYGDLAELDWEGYRARCGDIRRLDRILEEEGDSCNRYRASKQADVLMLGYLFSPTELCALFASLGYPLDDATWRRTVEYYLRRTSHGSTLSELVHGWVLARARRSDAWAYCQEALTGDVADLQGGTTGEGVHLGAMAGTADLVQRGLTGLETREDALWLDPVPVPEVSQFSFSFRYRGHWGIQLRVGAGELSITVPPSDADPIRVVLPDRTITVAPGRTSTVQVPGTPTGSRSDSGQER